ncbi:MAG: protein kinase [Planctomycetota bacterium]
MKPESFDVPSEPNRADDPSRDPAEPEVIEGHTVLEPLGFGGVGVVYNATQPGLDRTVALKRLRDTLMDDEDERMAFIFEARVAGELEHPNILPVHWLGQDSKGRPFYTMKRVQGRPLKVVLERLLSGDSALTADYNIRRLVRIFLNVCSAVSYAHAQRIIHRDIKPENIMLGDHGEVYLMDWGMAKRLPSPSESSVSGDDIAMERVRGVSTLLSKKASQRATKDATQKMSGTISRTNDILDFDLTTVLPGHTPPGVFIGTPLYTSPEQASGQSHLANERCDIYSLGAVLYEMLCLHPPISGESLTDILLNVIRGEIRPPADIAPAGRDIPVELSSIALKALSKSPHDRFQTVQDMMIEVERWIDGRERLRPICDYDFTVLPNSNVLPIDWDILAGTWIVLDGALRPIGNQDHMVHLNKPMPRDIRVEITATIASNTWGEIAPTLSAPPRERLKQYDAGYAVQFGADRHRFIKIARDAIDVISRPMVETPRDESINIIVERRGEIIRLEYNGTEVLRYRDYFPLSGNRFGLYAYAEGVGIQKIRISAVGMDLTVPALTIGDRLLAFGSYEEARIVYTEIAEAHESRSDGAVARYKAGLCSLKLKDFDAALDHFNKLDNLRFGPMASLGRALVAQYVGNSQAEFDELASIFRRFPSHRLLDEALYEVRSRAITRLKSTMPEQAIPLITLTLENSGTDYSYVADILEKTRAPLVNTGRVYGQGFAFKGWLDLPVGKSPEAARLFIQLILDDATESGDGDKAREIAEEALYRYGHPRVNAIIAYTVAEYLIDWGNTGRARDILVSIIRDSNDPATRLIAASKLADAWFADGELAEAFNTVCDAFENVNDERRRVSEMIATIADHLLRRGHIDEALSLSRILPQIFADQPQAIFDGLFVQASISRYVGDLRRAIDFLDQSLEQIDAGPNANIRALLAKTQIHLLDGYVRDAAKTIDDSYSFSHGVEQQYYAHYALVCLHQGLGDRAASHLNTILRQIGQSSIDRSVNRFIRSRFPDRMKIAPHIGRPDFLADALYYYAEYHFACASGGVDERMRTVNRDRELESAIGYYRQILRLTPDPFTVPSSTAIHRLEECGEAPDREPVETHPINDREAAALQRLLSIIEKK